MWTAGYKYSWRKMEAAELDGDKWSVDYVRLGAIRHSQVKAALIVKLHLRATGCHLPYEITQCYLPPDTSEHTMP